MQIFLKQDNRHPKRKIIVLTILKFMMGNSLEVQWLGLDSRSSGLILGQGSKIPQAAKCS